jgi:hypothetical protein
VYRSVTAGYTQPVMPCSLCPLVSPSHLRIDRLSAPVAHHTATYAVVLYLVLPHFPTRRVARESLTILYLFYVLRAPSELRLVPSQVMGQRSSSASISASAPPTQSAVPQSPPSLRCPTRKSSPLVTTEACQFSPVTASQTGRFKSCRF